MSLNGEDFTQAALVFTVLKAPTVISLFPRVGAIQGGTPVLVFGAGFVPSAHLSCAFGQQRVPATLLDSRTLRCEAPALLGTGYIGNATGDAAAVTRVHNGSGIATAGVVTVEVTVGPADFTASGVTFEYRRPATVASLSPVSGPASGGTLITLSGSGFGAMHAPATVSDDAFANASLLIRNLTDVHCYFGGPGGAAVPATIEADGRVTCAAPPLAEFRPSDAGFVALVVAVEVGTVGGLITNAGVVFTYEAVADVVGVQPPTGPTVGGTRVAVTGANFFATPQLACRWLGAAGEHGAVPAPARWVSRTQLQCVTPSGQAPGVCTLQVSSNGVSWAPLPTPPGADEFSGSAAFVFYEPAEVFYVQPTNGPARGGTVVTVAGARFAAVASSVPRCRFGIHSVVPASLVSDGALQCIAPAAPAGTIAAVAVSLNGGVDFSEPSPGTALFAYLAPPVDVRLVPASGPAIGGTRVAVHVASQANVGSILCRFGATVVVPETAPMPQDGGIELVCVAPANASSVAAPDAGAAGDLLARAQLAYAAAASGLGGSNSPARTAAGAGHGFALLALCTVTQRRRGLRKHGGSVWLLRPATRRGGGAPSRPRRWRHPAFAHRGWPRRGRLKRGLRLSFPLHAGGALPCAGCGRPLGAWHGR
jgi:hypothetical protein